MKNIFILPTDKPSKLFIDIDDNKLKITSPIGGEYMMNQNLYITSEENIEKGDWCYLNKDGREFVYKCTEKPQNSKNWGLKIILATDLDLIKDGVQEIDDEFLEWFIKNPQVQNVEIQTMLQLRHGVDWYDLPNQTSGRDPEGIYRTILKAVIPSKINQKYGLPSNVNLIKGKVEELRNLEDLQDAAKNAVLNSSDMRVSCSMGKFGEEMFKLGAKWQAERMYTEEEVYNIAKNAFELYRNNTLDDEELELEFERVIKFWLNKK